MTVFKQEAPSPTSNDVTALQVARQHRQSPTTTHHENVVHNSAMEDNSQNMFNSTINQLLSQTNLATLHNVVDSEYHFFFTVDWSSLYLIWDRNVEARVLFIFRF